MGCCSSKDKEEENSFLFQILSEHTGGINCIALSEDGSILVSGSEDKTCRLWTTKTDECECVGVLVGHQDYINAVAIEDNFVLSGSADKTIRKWDIATCECIFVFKGHNSLINRVICTGDLLFSSSYDRTARAWDFETGDLIRVFTGHKRGVYPLIFISGEDGMGGTAGKDLLITGSADFTARLWSYDTGKCLRSFCSHTGAVTCMSTDAHGKILFTGSTDNTIRSWKISTGDELHVFEGHTGAIICMHLYKKVLYSGSSDHTVRSWVSEYGRQNRTFKGHHHTISSLKVYHGYLFTTCGDSICRCYDAKSGALKRSFKGHAANVNALNVVGDRLFTASHDASIRVWDLTGVDEDPKASKPGTASRSHSTTNFSRARVGPHQPLPSLGDINGHGNLNGSYGSPADKTKIQIEDPNNPNYNSYDFRDNRRMISNGHRVQ